MLFPLLAESIFNGHPPAAILDSVTAHFVAPIKANALNSVITA
jgi:hypothetical protein